ncbi:unnamed protein product [Cylindrotheca closterium]|uniref:Uncharacterized protein n=1 Tax=Cylindrotheca closterium TaxID=2856 RepID=A0AAD2GA84_9STRA|nr:unnamed protein product [Cylindrotheca closterium]
MSLQLEEALFENNTLGYFNLHCGNSSQALNAVAHRDMVVEKLQQINRRAAKASDENTTTTMLMNAYHGTRLSGEMSYPNFKGDCRKLNYPNVDLLYQACDMAKVDCGHILIYRDPYAIMRSTNRRKFHNDSSIVAGIHMYTSMLSIIQTQLWTHSHRTLGCWSVLDPTEDVWQSIQRIFGWESRIEMAKAVRKIYWNPKPLLEEEKELIVPTIYAPYMDSFLRHHEDSVELCRQQAEANTHY